ncbi:MAG: tRNA lysidine(34) synthetase TilS [Anaerorhabdus sp.]
MNNLILNGKKWIIAVSSGPDSMALFQYCINNNIDVICAHVNYGKRDAAVNEEKSISDFCNLHSIKLETLHPYKDEDGNFQDWARRIRYSFFKDCLKKYDAFGILVAHHQDDVIETYLMQKKRGSIPDYYGIKEVSVINGCSIYRPLLSFSKLDCINYCKKYQTKYFIDESNLGDDYERNRVRHNIVEKLSKNSRDEILKEIELRNIELSNKRERLSSFLDDRLPLDDYFKLGKDDRLFALRLWLDYHQQSEAKASLKHLASIDEMLTSNRNFVIQLKDKQLFKQKEFCEIVGNEDKVYEFVLQSYQQLNTAYFQICDHGPINCGIKVVDDDYPLTIRCFRAGDRIKGKFHTKKISRLFIEKKIELSKRRLWPVVLNRKGEVILVPGICCSREYYSVKSNFFVIK